MGGLSNKSAPFFHLMTQFETNALQSLLPAEKIYERLSDFRQLEAYLPAGKIQNWQTDGETCRFQADGVGELGLIISHKEPFSLIQYTGHGKVPFNFYVQIHLTALNDVALVHVTAEAKLNPMLRMLVSKPVQKFLEMLNETIAGIK